MKRNDRRYATLIDGDGLVSNKTENKKRGFSSRIQYHSMLKRENTKNKKYRIKSISSQKLSYSNTCSHIKINKFKRHHLPETAIQIVREHFKEELIPDWFADAEDLKCCSGYYETDKNHKYVWRPIKFADQLEGISIYYTCVNRMDYCQKLLGFPDLPREVSQAILEIQDCYQLLTIHMEMKNCYLDEELEQEPSDKTEEPSPVAFFHPTQGPPFAISELPDILCYIPYISFWSDKNGYPTDNLLIQRLLFLLYKCLPYPYKRRSFENAIVESWSDVIQKVFGKNSDKNEQEKERMEYERKYTADIFQVTMRIVLASLTGIYEHCEVRQGFRARRKTLKWFCLARPSQEQISMWILRYKELVLCSFREFLFDMVDRIGGLSDFLGSTSYWNILKYNTYEMMDNARSQINLATDRYHEDYSVSENGIENLWNDMEAGILKGSMFNSPLDRDSESFEWFPGLSWFHKIQFDLDSCNRKILKNANRPKNAIFERMGLDKMDEVEAIKKKNNQINQDSINPDFLQPSIKDFIRDKIKDSDPFNPMSYYWLADLPINFNPMSIVSLRESEHMYESEEGASTLKDVLAYLYSYEPYEYQVLKCYFGAVEKKRGLLVYPFTQDIYDTQVQTLRRAYETIEGQELNDSAGLYYLCPNCNNIKITVRDFSQHNNPDNIGGWTSEGVCINLDDGKFYCTKISSRENPKKRNPTSNIIKEMFAKEDLLEAEDKKAAGDETQQPNRGVGSAGNIKRFMSLDDVKRLRSVVSKEEKASLEKYIEKRQQQEDCLNTELIPFYLPGHMLHTEKGNVIGCPRCMKPVYYSREMFRNGLDNISCGCADRPSESEFRCCVCDEECHNYCFVKLIWDDKNPKDARLRYACVCETHRNKWTSDLPGIPKLSQLTTERPDVRVTFNNQGTFVVEKAVVKKPPLAPRSRTAAKKLNGKKNRYLLIEKKMKDLKAKSKISRNTDFKAINNNSWN